MILGLEDWQYCIGNDKMLPDLENKFFYVLYLLAEICSTNNTLEKEIFCSRSPVLFL